MLQAAFQKRNQRVCACVPVAPYELPLNKTPHAADDEPLMHKEQKQEKKGGLKSQISVNLETTNVSFEAEK